MIKLLHNSNNETPPVQGNVFCSQNRICGYPSTAASKQQSHCSYNHDPQKERSHRKVLYQILAMDYHQQRRHDEAAALKWLCLLLQLQKQAEELQDHIFSFFQELREKQLRQQQQELCRDHRSAVSNRSIMGCLHHLCSYLLGILS